jgi:hypothetical protein
LKKLHHEYITLSVITEPNLRAAADGINRINMLEPNKLSIIDGVESRNNNRSFSNKID